MRLCVLRDRRPGHFHQAEGLAAIIAQLTDASIERIDIRPHALARNRIRKLALRSGLSPDRALRLLYGLRLERLAPPDVVIGSGRPTAAAGILLGRATGARFLYSGYLHDYDLRDIDLVLVRSARQAGEPNCVLAPIPTIIDPGNMRKPKSIRSQADLSGAEISLLLGGDAPGYRFDEADWRRIGELVAETATAFGVRWSVSTSRRTPQSAARRFGALKEAGIVAGFIDYQARGQNSAAELFAADVIVTTEDSMTMMAEAMAARRPVVALKPAAVQTRPSAEEIATMAARGGLTVLPARTLSGQQFADSIVELRVPERDPRDLIVEAVGPVIGLKPPVDGRRMAAAEL